MARAVEGERLRGWKFQVRKACLAEDLDQVTQLLQEIRYHPEINQTSYDIVVRGAVQETVRTGKTKATHFLLVEHDAAQFLSRRQFEVTLQQAVELKRPDDLLELLDCGVGKALLEENPGFARRLAMLAALRGDRNSLWILSRNGVNIHAENGKTQTLLAELACGKVEGRNSRMIVEWLVSEGMDLNKRDNTERNALHWAAKTGKAELVKALLDFGADVEAPSTRGKTALHLAAASELPIASAIVELLILAKADVNKDSDGGWTALHNASQVGDVAIVGKLLVAGANVNAALTSGVTSLHWACTRGHEKVAECLLSAPGIRRHEEDIWGSTPMLRAAQNGKTPIVKMLAPQHDFERLSSAQKHVCESKSFQATVTDFKYKTARHGHWTLQSMVNRENVSKVLYDPKYTVKIDQQSQNPSRQNFRWIHLPANNMAWAKTLFTKLFVEEETEDVDAFKALQKTLTQRHRGPEVHSTFMIPNSTYIKSNQWENPRHGSATPENRNGPLGSTEPPHTPTPKDSLRVTGNRHRGRRYGSASARGGLTRAPTMRTTSDSIATLISEDEPTPIFNDLRPRRKPGNITLFMPYLHFEFHEQRQIMSDTVRKYRRSKAQHSTEDLPLAPTEDELLIQAYLDNAMTLHPRRTLDQSFYRGFDTRQRDADQVVFRYCRDKKWPLRIFMTDQLWLWVFGKDLLVTSFPQRWGQGSSHRNDPLNILDGVIEDINSKTRPPVSGVADLAILIFSRCLGSFDRHRPNDPRYHFMDMFESSIGRLSLREPELFETFDASAAQAAKWLREHSTRHSRGLKFRKDAEELKFVDELLEIKEETKLLKELKDIRDELHMIKAIFRSQESVLKQFQSCVREQLDEVENDDDDRTLLGLGLNRSDVGSVTGTRNYGFREQEQLIKAQIADVERMDDQAKAIFESLTQLLDFKQMHASSIEARFAREQAGLTALQGETIMVFTIVTIVFLPISFVASIFTMNIESFSHRAGGLSIGYVSKFVFGIGLTISFVLIILAFMVGDFLKMVGTVVPKRLSSKPMKSRVDNDELILANSMAAIAETKALTIDERDGGFEPKPLNRVTSGYSANSWRSPATSWRRMRRGSAMEGGRISEDQV